MGVRWNFRWNGVNWILHLKSLNEGQYMTLLTLNLSKEVKCKMLNVPGGKRIFRPHSSVEFIALHHAIESKSIRSGSQYLRIEKALSKCTLRGHWRSLMYAPSTYIHPIDRFQRKNLPPPQTTPRGNALRGCWFESARTGTRWLIGRLSPSRWGPGSPDYSL